MIIIILIGIVFNLCSEGCLKCDGKDNCLLCDSSSLYILINGNC